VVVLSGFATEGIRKHLLELGVDRVFDKANTEEFVRWLDDIGGASSAGRERQKHPKTDSS
jgi:hypothetical protein